MKVSELILALGSLPPTADVFVHCEGAARVAPDVAWLSQGGAVVLAESDDPIYSDNDRPLGAPSRKDAPHWTHADGVA